LEGVGAVGRGDGGWEFAGCEGFESVIDWVVSKSTSTDEEI
jgi:hypothetical protein